MSHSPDLIRQIRTILERDYPPGQYEYIVEKAIPDDLSHMCAVNGTRR